VAQPNITSRKPHIVAILNLSEDSFSDGGRYRDPVSAADGVQEMLAAGAHWIELGAASSHPDAAAVSASDEIAALEPVLDKAGESIDRVGVDTWKPEVQRFCLERGVAFINDIAGFRDESLHEELAAARCALVVMHSIQQGKATRVASETTSIVAQIIDCLSARVDALAGAGVERERIIVDPGMGFFLGATPQPSLEVLAAISRLKEELALPVLLSVSRKSFLGAVTGRDVANRGAATLVAELYAAAKGADYIRTHDVRALVDGLAILDALGRTEREQGENRDGL
jgi:dihydropteroate synthase type 2